jgi:hypothetical protein
VAANLGIVHDSINDADEFSYFPSLTLRLKHAFDPRLSVSLVDVFNRNDEPALANPFGLSQQRRVSTSNTLGLSVDWLLDILAIQGYYRLSTFFSGTDTVSHIVGENIGIPLGALTALRTGYEFSSVHTEGVANGDTTGHVVWASAARQLGPSRSIGILGSYSIQSRDRARIWNASVFNTFYFPGRFSISGDLGYSVLTTGSGRDFSTVTSHTNATYQFGNGYVAIAILSDFNQTYFGGQDFGITLTRSYTGTVGYALTPLVDTSVRASYSENSPTGAGNSAAGVDSEAYSAGANLTWRLRRGLTLGLDYTYTRYTRGFTSVSVPGGVAVENRGSARLSASF